MKFLLDRAFHWLTCTQVLSSYVLASGALIEKRALGIDGDKYQKVMGFAGGFMQAAQEVNGCAEKLGRGTELMALLHKLEDAKNAKAAA